MSSLKRTTSEASPQKAKHAKHPTLQECDQESEASLSERFSENVQQCTVHITHCKNDYHRNGEHIEKHIYRKVCALANSGGGVLILDNADYEKAKPKDLDTFLQRLENNLKYIIEPSSYCDVFDVSGKFSDKRIFLFVKAPGHVCTVNSHLYLPSDTSVTLASYKQAEDIIKGYSKDEGSLPTNDLNSLPKFDSNEFEYGKSVSFHECKQIQLKHYPSNKELLRDEKIRQSMSAFANCDGGQIFIGIDDKKSIVYGQSIANQEAFAEEVHNLVEKFHWGFHPERGVHWDVKFFPVKESPCNSVVIVVSVAGMRSCGGVFTKTPESFYCKAGPPLNEDGECCSFGLDEWKQKILPRVDWQRGYQELLSSFKRMDLSGTPLLMVKDAVKKIRDAFFPADESFPVTPKGFESAVPEAEAAIKQIQATCSTSRRRGILMGCHSLLASLDIDIPPAEGVICDLLLISRDIGLHLFTLYKGNAEDHSQIAEYSRAAAQALKVKLALRGDCKEKFYVSCQVVPCSAKSRVDVHLPVDDGRYPASYAIGFNRGKFKNILNALVFVFASIPSVLSTKLGVRFLHLLTHDQFLLVQQKINQYREFWVQGGAGTGKSIVAVEFMTELRRRDPNLEKEEILYVCENKGMRERIRRAEVCECVCRKEFMMRHREFPEVKHVILDEVQSFRMEDGNWLQKARRLVRQSCGDTEHDSGFASTLESESQRGSASELESQSPIESGSASQEPGTRLPSVSEFRSQPVSYDESKNIPGYLWMFIDNEQVNHYFPSGIPDVRAQIPSFRLKKVIRNSTSIFNYAKTYLNENAACDLEIGHDFEGLEVDHRKYSKGNQLKELKEVLQSLFREGYSKGEIVILFDKERSIRCLPSLERELNLEKIVGAVDDHLPEVVVTSFRQYSGLDRPVVILVDMKPSLEKASMCNQTASMYCATTRGMVRLIELEEKRVINKRKLC